MLQNISTSKDKNINKLIREYALKIDIKFLIIN